MAIWDFLDKRKAIEQQKVICLNCELPTSLRITKDWTSEICDCGCLLYYPPRLDREYGVRKFIPKNIYLANKAKHHEREGFIKEMLRRGITIKHPVHNSKFHRMLTHENEIEKGNFKEVKKDLLERTKKETETIEEEGLTYGKR